MIRKHLESSRRITIVVFHTATGLKSSLFSTCLLFVFLLVPLPVSRADVIGADPLSGPGNWEQHTGHGMEGRFVSSLPLYKPLKTWKYSPRKLVLCLAEKELFCSRLYAAIVEGYWECPGINVIVYTTPLGLHCSWRLNSTNNVVFSFPSGLWICIPEKLSTSIPLIWFYPVPLSDQTVLATEP